MAERWVRVTVDGASANALLADDLAPRAAEKFWSALPIDTVVTHSKWCGAAVSFHGSGPSEPEEPVCSLYPGVLASRPESGELLLSYGEAECRSELGVEYANIIARVLDGDALFARLRRMHDEGDGRLSVERLATPPVIASRAQRLVEVEVDGAVARYALRDDASPRTCALLWEMLPIETTTFYSRWAGDAGIVETRPARVGELLQGDLESPATSMYPGTLCCGPTPNWMDIYLSFGGAECRGPRGRRYVTVAAEVRGEAKPLFDTLRRTRREGEKKIVIRRVTA